MNRNGSAEIDECSPQDFGIREEAEKPLVCVQGLGFVGAAMSVATAASCDRDGVPFFNVVGLDLDNDSGCRRVSSINQGAFPFESGDKSLHLETESCFKQGNLRATTNPKILQIADIVIVDVNLDVNDDNGKPESDFEGFLLAVETVVERIIPNTLVIVETTVPPGTCENIVLPTLRRKFRERGFDEQSVRLAHSYERVMPGEKYLDSIINYWRVFAAVDEASSTECETFLSRVINTEDYPLRKLSSMTASETAKIVENTYRAINIALVDEWSQFAEIANINLNEVLVAIRDRPTHSNIRQPGFGVGGYCLTKDPLFGTVGKDKFFSDNQADFPFANLAIQRNRQMPIRHLNRVEQFLGKAKSEVTIVVMGIAYRSEVDDTRNSASEIFYREAAKRGMQLLVHDPHVKFWNEMNIEVASSLPPLENVDMVVFCVAHKCYKTIDFRAWFKGRSIPIYDTNGVLAENQIVDLKSLQCPILFSGRGNL